MKREGGSLRHLLLLTHRLPVPEGGPKAVEAEELLGILDEPWLLTSRVRNRPNIKLPANSGCCLAQCTQTNGQ